MRRYMDKKYSFWIRFSFGIVFVMMSICCTQQTDATDSKISVNFNIRDGKRLFQHFCSPCHGENADGSGRYFPTEINPQPPDMTSPDYVIKTREEVVFRAIKFGTQEIGKSNYSPPYGKTLSDEEIKNIIEYLYFLKLDNEKPLKEK